MTPYPPSQHIYRILPLCRCAAVPHLQHHHSKNHIAGLLGKLCKTANEIKICGNILFGTRPMVILILHAVVTCLASAPIHQKGAVTSVPSPWAIGCCVRIVAQLTARSSQRFERPKVGTASSAAPCRLRASIEKKKKRQTPAEHHHHHVCRINQQMIFTAWKGNIWKLGTIPHGRQKKKKPVC